MKSGKHHFFFYYKNNGVQFMLEAKLLEGAQSFVFCWQIVTE